MAQKVFDNAERVIRKNKVGLLMVAEEVAPESRYRRLPLPWVEGFSHGAILLKEHDAGNCESYAHGRPRKMRKPVCLFEDRRGRAGMGEVGRVEDFGGGCGSVLDAWSTPVKYGFIRASRNLEDEHLMRTLRREVQLDAFSQFGRI